MTPVREEFARFRRARPAPPPAPGTAGPAPGGNGPAALLQAGALPAQLPVPADPDNDELLVQVADPAGRIVSASARMAGVPVMLPGRPPPPGGVRSATVHGLAADPPDPFRVMALTTT